MLTIIIPTFNRLSFLKETLLFIDNQIKKNNLENLVSVFVADNCSQDRTSEYLSEKEISHYINKSNIGITRNIEKALKLVSSEYVWIFGDDDLFLDGLLKYILNFLQVTGGDHLYLPSKSFKSEKEILCTKKDNYKFLKFDFEREFEKLSALIEVDSGFISSHIHKTKILKKIFENQDTFNSLKDNNYYVKYVNYCFFVKKETFILNKPIVFKRVSEGSHFSNSIDSIVKTYIFDTNQLFTYFLELDPYLFTFLRKQAKKRCLIYLIIKLSNYPSRGLLFRESIDLKSFCIFALSLLPKKMILAFYLTYKKIKKSPMPHALKNTKGTKT